MYMFCSGNRAKSVSNIRLHDASLLRPGGVLMQRQGGMFVITCKVRTD